MHEAVAISVGDEQVARWPERNVGGVVERLSRPVARTQRRQLPAIRVVSEDQVGIAIDHPQAALRIAGDHVRVDDVLAPGAQPAAIVIEDDDCGTIGLDERVAPEQHVDAAGMINGDVGDLALGGEQRAEGPLDLVEVIAKRDDQVRTGAHWCLSQEQCG